MIYNTVNTRIAEFQVFMADFRMIIDRHAHTGSG